MVAKTDKVTASQPASGAVVGETEAIGPGHNFIKRFNKRKLFIGLAILLVLICALVAWLISNNNKNVVIGNITITPKQVDELSGEISQYTKSNANVSFGSSPHKVARNDLILNAALKNEANKYNVKVTQDDLDAAQVNQYRAYGSMSAYRSFVRSEGITQLTRITAENDAYKAKLKDKIIATKDLFVASINYDTPYVNNAPNPTALRAQAVKTMQTKFLPLFQQGKSTQDITAQADTSPAKPAQQNNGSGNGTYFTSMPSTVYYARGCTTASPCFNDVKSKPISGLPPLVSTQSEIDKLNTVGQNTGVINSEAGFVGVIRLVGKTSGSYNSWDQFFQSYDKKYANNKLLASILLPAKTAVLTVNKLAHQLEGISHQTGALLLPKASADASTCSDNVHHFVDLNIHAYNQSGGNLSGATVTETRPNANCPNSGGRYVDSQGGANHGPNGGSTNGSGQLSFNDNCYNSPPDWSQSGPGGNNLAWVHVYDSRGDDSTMIVGNNYNGLITEQNAIGKAITESGIWSNGLLNDAGSLTIELHYRPVPPPTWTLAGDTTVDGQHGTITVKPGTTHTFRHTVTNGGPAPASYNWKVTDDSRGGFANNGLPHGSANLVNPGPPGAPSSLARNFPVPAGARNGDTYCQRIEFTNGAGPNDDGYSNDVKACVKVNDNPTGCAGGPTGCVTFPSCTSYDIHDSNSTDSGGDNSFTYVTISGTNNDTSGYFIAHNGSHNFTYTAVTPTIHITVGTYYNDGPRDSHGNLQPSSSYTLNFNCYHATCGTPYVTDGLGPNGTVIAGQQFHIAVPITNDNGSAYRQTIPSSIDGGAYRFSITERGFPGTEHDTGFSLDPGETQVKTIDEVYTAPNSVTNVDYIFYPDMAPKGSLFPDHSPPDNICSIRIPIYQQFNIQNPNQVTDLQPTNENPTEANYYTTFDLVSANPSVGIPQVYIPSSSVYTALGITKDSYSSNAGAGDYSPGTHKWTGNSPDTGITAGPDAAGHQYCTSLGLGYTSGYIGPGGSNDILGQAGSYNQRSCDRVVNEPNFKVYHSDISAGGDFDQCTTNGGTLAGYADISDPAGATRGSTTQLSALALLKITGVASAKTSADITGSPTKLSFANFGVQVDSSGTESPVLGGQFGGCRTLTNEKPPASARALTSSVVPPTLTPGAYTYGTGNSRLTIPGGLLGAGQNYSIFVKGDVYISNNITYGNGWGAGTAPSFILHATGNIYIAPGVTSLAGVYIAQEKPDHTAGKIYTCADSTGFAPMSPGNLYNGCKNQLVVFGSFVADQINLMRSFGSLRDEIPNPGSPGLGGGGGVWSCGGGTCNPNLSGYTCVHTNEPGDPASYTWGDNQLCLPNGFPIQMAWTYYATNGDSDAQQAADLAAKNGHASVAYLKNHGYPYCTPWTPKDSSGNVDDNNWGIESGGLYSNQLCLSQDIGLTFGTDPSPPGKICIKVYEPVDPLDNWQSGYYLCVPPTALAPTPPTPKGPPFNCSNRGIVISPKSCAGEIFEYSPALYLSNGGGTTQPSGGGSLQLQSITSLPPVL